MSVLFVFVAIPVVILLLFYPVAVLVDRLLFGSWYDDRIREWRILASKLTLTEAVLVDGINAVRKQHGLPEIPAKPVIEGFGQVGPWTEFKDQIADATRVALGRMRRG